jgi:hypothetical protein
MKEKTSKEDIIALAKNTKHYCELLITQSEEWEKVEKGEKEKGKKENRKTKKTM